MTKFALPRYAMLIALCALLVGCPATNWQINLTNETDAPIQVEIGKIRCKVARGKTTVLRLTESDNLMNTDVIVHARGGPERVSNVKELFEGAVEKGAEYPNMYVVVSADGMALAENQRPVTDKKKLPNKTQSKDPTAANYQPADANR